VALDLWEESTDLNYLVTQAPNRDNKKTISSTTLLYTVFGSISHYYIQYLGVFHIIIYSIWEYFTLLYTVFGSIANLTWYKDLVCSANIINICSIQRYVSKM
jgi:hypothetical protein